MDYTLGNLIRDLEVVDAAQREDMQKVTQLFPSNPLKSPLLIQTALKEAFAISKIYARPGVELLCLSMAVARDCEKPFAMLSAENVRRWRNEAALARGVPLYVIEDTPVTELVGPPAENSNRNGFLDLDVNVGKRTVSRHGYANVVELARSESGWHIFEACWKARGANASEAVKNGYPNEMTGIYKAVSDLNAKLAALKIKVHEFCLVEAADLTKM